MKKAIRWRLSLPFFLLIGFLLFTEFTEILRHKTGIETDMVHSFYSVQKDTIDVLGLGSSHLFYGVQPNILWNSYGLAAFDLGSPQQTIALSYYLLRSALKYQKPKAVLLEACYFSFDGLFTQDERFRHVSDVMPLDEIKIDMINTCLADASFARKMTYYLPFFKYHSRWAELEAQDFVQKPYLKGGYLDDKRKKLDVSDLDLNIDHIRPREIPEVNLRYLDQMIDLCEKNEIQLIVFVAPYVANSQESFDESHGVNVALGEYLAKKGIPFLYFQQMDQPEFDYKKDFLDITHLNYYGAQKLSDYLGRYLSENCGLPDRRGEPAYLSWDEDYEKYAQDVKEMLEEE